MSDALRLELDETVWPVGDVITGVVQVLEDIPKNEELRFELTQAGKRTGKATPVKQVLHRGGLRRGDELPIEVLLPSDLPFTFGGHAHSVSWTARAVADVPWAVDPKSEQPITLVPAKFESDEAPEVEGFAALRRPKKDEEFGIIGKILVWAILGPLIAALIILLFPILLIVFARKKIIDTRLRKFELDISDDPRLLGTWVPVAVRFRLKKAIDLAGLKLLVQGTEQWTTSSGKSSTTHYHHFFQSEQVILSDTILAVSRRARHGEFEFQTFVKLPPDGLPTMGGSVYYNVTATLDIRGWPDPSESKKIVTLSGKVEAPAEPEPLPLEETCNNVEFIRKGDHAPSGVDISTADSSIWLWVIIPILAIGGIVGGAVAFPALWAIILLGCSAAALLFGLLGFAYQVMR